jgi:S-adenosylmethionine uptake transporter
MGSNRFSTEVTAFVVAATGIATFSAMDAVMKGLALAIGAYNTVLWRTLIAIPLSGLLFVLARGRRPSAAAMRVHLIRGAITSVMSVLFFWGIARMPIAEAVALSFVAPIIALYLAAILLGESIGSRAIGASALGIAGVLLILSGQWGTGGRSGDLAGAAAILLSAALYAYNIVLMRQQALLASPQEVAFFQSLIVAPCLALAAPFLAVVPPADQVPALTMAASLGLMSLVLLAWAYRRAEAQYLATVEYTALVWGALFGYLVFDERVGITTIAGAALIVLGCVIAARAGRQPLSPAEAT